jgi:hypothetical protein
MASASGFGSIVGSRDQARQGAKCNDPPRQGMQTRPPVPNQNTWFLITKGIIFSGRTKILWHNEIYLPDRRNGGFLRGTGNPVPLFYLPQMAI